MEWEWVSGRSDKEIANNVMCGVNRDMRILSQMALKTHLLLPQLVQPESRGIKSIFHLQTSSLAQ